MVEDFLISNIFNQIVWIFVFIFVLWAFLLINKWLDNGIEKLNKAEASKK